jgi:hypothetical protein
MKYTSRNPNGINQIASSSVAISVLNTDVAVFTTSSFILGGALTSSNALITGNVVVLGTASINTLVVNQTKYSSGSNQLGDGPEDTQTLFGTVRIPTGSFTVTGSSIMTGSLNVTGGITGSLFGTASYIPNLNEVTTAGNTTTNAITVGGLTVDTDTLFVDASNNRIGIGTTIPGFAIDVQGDTDGIFRQHIRNSNNGTSAQTAILLRNDVNTQYMFGVVSTQFNSVGLIGNDSFVQHFDSTGFYPASGLVLKTYASNPIKFQTNNIERFRVTSVGNVLINTTTDAGFKLDVNGTGRFSGNLTITGSATNSLLVKGSGTTSSTTSLRVENSSASPSLIIRDDQTIILTGAVQTTGSISISGSLLIGENSSSLYTSRTTIINSGSTDLYSIPTSSYDAVYFDYVIKSGSNARAGQVFSTYITTASTYIDNSTSDIGNTSVFYFSSSISSSNLVLHGSTTSDGWKVKTIIRGL